jgi:hypothetical protein
VVVLKLFATRMISNEVRKKRSLGRKVTATALGSGLMVFLMSYCYSLVVAEASKMAALELAPADAFVVLIVPGADHTAIYILP